LLDRHEIILDTIAKKKAKLEILYSYNPVPDALKGKGHLVRVIQGLEQEIAHLAEEDRKLLLQAAQRRLLLNLAEKSRTDTGPTRSGFTRPQRSAKRPRTKQQLRRDGVFFGALQANLRGLDYCKYLDQHRMRPPEPWLSNGCPTRYVAAYKSGPPWAKKIQDEKHRFKLRYDATSTAQREALIQAAARPTRS
jgi:hypothetical protein